MIAHTGGKTISMHTLWKVFHEYYDSEQTYDGTHRGKTLSMSWLWTTLYRQWNLYITYEDS